MKAQLLADFLVECTWLEEISNEGPIKQLDLEIAKILHVDSVLNV